MSGRAALAAILLMLASALAGAQSPPERDPSRGEFRHGWLVARSLVGGGVTLVHLPPRSGPDAGGTVAGQALPQRTLGTMPSAMASWEERVFVLYPTGARIEVYSIRAVAGGVRGYWVLEPSAGAAAEPALSAPGEALHDAAVTSEGLCVLTADSGWRLWRLEGGSWESLEPPRDLGMDATSVVRLVRGDGRLRLLRSGEQTELWTRAVDGGWEREMLPFRLTGECLSVFSWGDEVCVASWSETNGLEVWSGRDTSVRLVHEPSMLRPTDLTSFDGGRRIAALLTLRNEQAQGIKDPIARWEIAEFSVGTGRLLYRGELRAGDWMSVDLHVIGLAMVALMLGVVFYLLQPTGREPALVMPSGFALASPGTRVVAAMIDAAITASLVGLVSGHGVLEILLVAPLLQTPGGLLAAVAFIAGGAAYTTLAEWGSGRTLGKALVGCRVVSIDPNRPRPGLLRTASRNVFRWMFAPWALVGMTSLDMRHRGDRVAGTVVAVWIDGRDERGDPRGGDNPGP